MAFDTRNPRLYLASRSPRRRELLTQMGILFDTLAFRSPPRQDDDVDETAHDGEAALVYVERVARLKAEHGWRTVEMRRLMPQLVLAADTTLEFQGEIIGKPTDAGDARAVDALMRLHDLIGHRLPAPALGAAPVFDVLADDGDRRFAVRGVRIALHENFFPSAYC